MFTLLKVYSSDEYAETPDLALVKLPRRYIQDILNKAHKVKRMGRWFHQAEWWDYSPTYFPYIESIAKWLECAEVAGYLLVDDEAGNAIAQEIESKREAMEAETISVRRDDVLWRAYLKHTSIEVSTAAIPLRVLRGMLKKSVRHAAAFPVGIRREKHNA